jgi:hypothetical protein
MTLFDEGGNSASDSVTVTVIDGNAPSINSPEDLEYTAGRVGNYFIWSISDSNPEDYEIYLDDVVWASGNLNDTSESLTIFTDDLSIGTHNYTLVARDVVGNSATDTVLVTVNPGSGTTTGTTTSTTSTTGETNGTTDDPLSAPIDGIIIVVSYTACIAFAIIVAEYYRRRSS